MPSSRPQLLFVSNCVSNTFPQREVKCVGLPIGSIKALASSDRLALILGFVMSQWALVQLPGQRLLAGDATKYRLFMGKRFRPRL